MASTIYKDFSYPAINAAWLNDVNNFTYLTGVTKDLLAAGGGAGIVGFDANESYVAGTVGRRLQDRILVSEFGVVGDGVTNDYAAICAARDRAYALNAELHFDFVGLGRYFIGTNELVFNQLGQVITFANGVEIRGNGSIDGYVVTFASVGGTVQPSLTHPTNTRVTGLRIRTVAPFSAAPRRFALRISCGYSLFTDCSATVSADNGGNGLAMEGDSMGNGPYYTILLDCNFQGAQNGLATGIGIEYCTRPGTTPSTRNGNTCTHIGGRVGGFAEQVVFRGGGNKVIAMANENFPGFGTAYVWRAESTIHNVQNGVISPYIENANIGFLVEANTSVPYVTPGKTTGATTLISDPADRLMFLGYDGIRSMRLPSDPTPSVSNRGGIRVGKCNNPDPETLDFYEEGTWTPTLVGATTPGDYSISSTDGGYQRVGNRVKCWARMTITVNSAGTGFASFGGLPYPKGSNRILVGFASSSNVDLAAGAIGLTAEHTTTSSSSNFLLKQTIDNAPAVNLDVTGISSNDVIQISVEYTV